MLGGEAGHAAWPEVKAAPYARAPGRKNSCFSRQNHCGQRGDGIPPGRPVTYGTTDDFLSHFNIENITDLPGQADLKAAGLLDPRLPDDFEMPSPNMIDDLSADEEPLEDEEVPDFFEDFMDKDQA
ncbi:MAG: SMC-Scp complex subunit ScpB [Hyphomonadaceae bacterium]|nr:SMC-Scp complex subunit ScpB [Hyphomonadaceae bacterium]